MVLLKKKKREVTMNNVYYRRDRRIKLLKYADYCAWAMIFFYINAIVVTFPLTLLFSSELVFWILLLGLGYIGIMCQCAAFILTDLAYKR